MGGRWEEGSGWGTHDVNPWLIHVNVWQKSLQYCKVISLQLIKINGEKKSPENPSIISKPQSHSHQTKKKESRRANRFSFHLFPYPMTLFRASCSLGLQAGEQRA